MVSSIIEAIKLIGALIGVFKTVFQLIRDYQQSQKETKARDAYDELDKAETPEQVQEANKNIVSREH